MRLPPYVKVPPPVKRAVNEVLEQLGDDWGENALAIQKRLAGAIEANDHNAGKAWSVAGAVATEKVLLVNDRPTSIVANVHAHRYQIEGVMAMLALAGDARSLPLDPARVAGTRPLPTPSQ